MFDNCIKKVDQRFVDDEVTYEQNTCTVPPARPAVDVMPEAPTGVLDQGESQGPRPQAPRPLPPVKTDADTPQQSSPPKPTVVFQPGSS